MMKSDYLEEKISVHLRRGESHQQHLRAGTIIHVQNGELVVREAPQWLAERMVSISQPVGSHQSYAVMYSGWLHIYANESATIILRQTLTHRVSLYRHIAAFSRAMIGSMTRNA
jgi:hypothetical protein